MDSQLFKTVGALAGVGGIGLAVVVYIFREIIRKEIFPRLTKNQAYSLLNRMIVLTSIIGLAGIVAYVIVSLPKETLPQRTEPTASPTPTPPVNMPGASEAQTPPPNESKVQHTGRVNQPDRAGVGVSYVSGFVFDADKKPLQGATISIDEFIGLKPATTASNGSFSLEKIPKQNRETIRLRITMAGYKTEVRDVVIGNYPRVITLEKVE